MVRHSDKVVDGFAVIFVDDVWAHVKAFDGEVDLRVQLISEVSIVTESFQAYHQHGR